MQFDKNNTNETIQMVIEFKLQQQIYACLRFRITKEFLFLVIQLFTILKVFKMRWIKIEKVEQ